MKRLIIGFVNLSLLILFCASPNESKHDPPANHQVNKNGAKHKSGLNSPEANCSSCHGQDLRGGTVGVSCYECHGKKW